MSTLIDLAGLRAPARTPPARSGTRLSVVPKSSPRRARIPFAFLVVVALAAGVVGLLLVNTSLQQGAFAMAALETKASALLARQQSLELAVAGLRDPGRLARRAERLGMVPHPSPTFLRLSDGRVLGAPGSGLPNADGGPDTADAPGPR